jgi:ABC-2 type transport system permease protein
MTSTAPIVETSTLSHSRHFSIYWKETKYEFLKRLRMPMYSLSLVLFPTMFYVLFGLLIHPKASIDHVGVASYLMATMACYGVIGVGLFGFGVSVAVERGQGWLEVKRASPMPAAAPFVGRLLTCLLFSVVVALPILVTGIAFGGVRLTMLQALFFIAALVGGSIPFCALGLAIGYFAKPNSAIGVVNLIYLPLSFFSGLWVPVEGFSSMLQNVAHILPAYHFGRLVLNVVGVHNGPIGIHIEVLAGFALICLGIARLGFQKDEGKLYG